MATKKSSHTTRSVRKAPSRKRRAAEKDAGGRKSPAPEQAVSAKAVSGDETVAPQRMASVWTLSRRTAGILWSRPWLFVVIAAVYLALNVLLVRTASATDVPSIKDTISDALSGNTVGTGLTVVPYLLIASGAGSSEAGAVYQSFLLIITSLATIWALREIMAGHKFGFRDPYYKGMYPLVPVILVVLINLAALAPLAISSGLFGAVAANGIAVNDIQLALWSLLPIGGFLLTMFFLTTTLLAAYIVTLPDMTPLKALRSARGLVKGRRWTLIRKLLYLPLALLVILTIVSLPFIWLWPAGASGAFLVLTAFGLLVYHTYMYVLYRELLK